MKVEKKKEAEMDYYYVRHKLLSLEKEIPSHKIN
jgi:hypothetical protein